MKKENSLQSFCERQDRMYLLQEWDQEKNAPLTPDTVHKGSHQKVWWNCSAGHAWQAEVRSRSGGSRCPYCTRRVLWVGDNDLAAVNPVLAAQWNTERNGTLSPDQVTSFSNRKVWWRCDEGHIWKTAIYSRTGKQKCGCPVCAGKTKQPSQYARP